MENGFYWVDLNGWELARRREYENGAVEWQVIGDERAYKQSDFFEIGPKVNLKGEKGMDIEGDIKELKRRVQELEKFRIYLADIERDRRNLEAQLGPRSLAGIVFGVDTDRESD